MLSECGPLHFWLWSTLKLTFLTLHFPGFSECRGAYTPSCDRGGSSETSLPPLACPARAAIPRSG